MPPQQGPVHVLGADVADVVSTGDLCRLDEPLLDHVKHQVGLVWNEVSRRYVDFPPELYSTKTWRGRPQNSKQGSAGEIELDPTMKHMMETTMESCLILYTVR